MKPRRRSPSVTTAVMSSVVLLLALTVASALWWEGAGRVVSPGRLPNGAPGAGPVTGLQAQAANGEAIVGHWTPPGPGPPVLSYQVRVVTEGGGRTVATAQTWSPSVVVGGLDIGGRYQLVVAPSGRGAPPVSSASVVVLADQRPDPPTRVAIAQLGGTDGLRASWDPAPSGMAATGAVVQLYDGPAYQGYVTCRAGCTGASFRGLAYGRRYTVRVVPTNGAGQGPATASNAVDLANPCPSVAECVTIDATAAIGRAGQRADGFLNSLYPVGDMVARARALKPRSWRGAPSYQAATGVVDWSSWDAAGATGAQTTLLLSSLWHAATNAGAGARTPWADWGAYAAWVTQTVRSIEASGHPVSYWEIQNEPDSPGYFSPADRAGATTADYLEQFRVAYQAIKAADPAARVVGPSLSHFADYPGEYDSHEPDLVTFLDFAARHGMALAAVAWHEIDDDLGSQPRDYNSLPQMIEDHVSEARRLIADRPALGGPQVWVNEYGHHKDYAIPGWTVGDLAALERSSVDRAGRSCWSEQGPDGLSDHAYDDCASPTLDGLLAPDGSTPRAIYWVYATYARMTGRIVAGGSSDAAVSVLATSDDGPARVVTMIGRHVSCLPAVNLSCLHASAVTVPAVAVTVRVRLPWLTPTADVTIALVPPTWGPVLQPPPVFQGPVPASGRLLTLTLPAVGDGEVYVVTIGR